MRRFVLWHTLIFFAFPVWGEERVWVENVPVSSGVIPDTQVLVRNASGYDLSVWVANSDDEWIRYEVLSEHSLMIEMSDAVVGIATTESDDEDKSTPSIPSSNVRSGGNTDGFFYFRRLTGGTRALFCWSTSQDRWLIQSFGERLCS